MDIILVLVLFLVGLCKVLLKLPSVGRIGRESRRCGDGSRSFRGLMEVLFHYKKPMECGGKGEGERERERGEGWEE